MRFFHVKINKITQLCIWLVLVTIFYFLRDLSPIRIPEFIFIILFTCAFFSLPVEDAFAIYIFSLALTLPSNPIRLVYFVITIFKLNLEKHLNIKITMIASVFMLVIIQMVNCVMYDQNDIFQSLLKIFEILLFLSIPLVWSSIEFTTEKIRNTAFCYLMGMTISFISLIVMTIRGRGMEVLLGSTSFFRLGMGLSEYYSGSSGMISTFNTNDIANMAALGISLILVLLNMKKMKKYIAIPMMIFFSIVAMLTKSRTGLLTILIIFTVYYIYLIIKQKRIKEGLLLLILIIISIYIILGIMPDVWSGILGRFTNQSDITNGRIEINNTYIDVWLNNIWCFIFGYGIGYYPEYTQVGISAHNGIIDIIMSVGLLGLLGILVFNVELFRKNWKTKRYYKNRIALLPLLSIVISIMAGQYLTTTYIHLRVCFVLLFAGIMSCSLEKTEMGKCNGF